MVGHVERHVAAQRAGASKAAPVRFDRSASSLPGGSPQASPFDGAEASSRSLQQPTAAGAHRPFCPTGVLSTPEFLGLSGDRTIFNIHTARGVDVAPFSAVRREHEVLLPAGCALRITGVLPKSTDGLTMINCEDDPDAPPLLS